MDEGADATEQPSPHQRLVSRRPWPRVRPRVHGTRSRVAGCSPGVTLGGPTAAEPGIRLVGALPGRTARGVDQGHLCVGAADIGMVAACGAPTGRRDPVALVPDYNATVEVLPLAAAQAASTPATVAGEERGSAAAR